MVDSPESSEDAGEGPTEEPPETPPGSGNDPLPELELSFPCTWTYTVVVEHESHLRAALSAALEGEAYELEPSNKSASGRYSSYHLEVQVSSDERRLSIFRVLHEHPGVKYVL